jgi:ribonuclease R
MVGQTSGETYRLGDPVTVRLVEAAPVAGALRFEIQSTGRAGSRPAPERRGRARERSQPPGRKRR